MLGEEWESVLGCGGGKERCGNWCEGGMLSMSSCAHSPSERMCWIVRGGEERCGERCGGRCGKVCCGVGEMRGGG